MLLSYTRRALEVPQRVLLSWWHEFRPALQCLLLFPTEYLFQLGKSKPWVSSSQAEYDWFEIKSLAVSMGEPLLWFVPLDPCEMLEEIPKSWWWCLGQAVWLQQGQAGHWEAPGVCLHGLDLSPCNPGVPEPAPLLYLPSVCHLSFCLPYLFLSNAN